MAGASVSRHLAHACLLPRRLLARALHVFISVSQTPTDDDVRMSGNIASEFVKARIAAFTRAHGVLRLCKVCLDREVSARRLSPLPRRSETQELFDPMRDWCFLCGALAPTLPALPRSARTPRRAA
jgi:hypothetical protein